MTDEPSDLVVVPNTIYTTPAAAAAPPNSTGTFYHRHTKEIYTYEKEEEVTIMTANNNSVNHSVNHDDVKDEELPPPSEPYQELKWNHAPLLLNDSFGHPDELLLKDKQTLPIHAGRTALLVVDVQPEYWSQCPAVRQDFPDFPDRLQQLVTQSRAQQAKIIWVRADYRYAHSPWLVQFARLHQGRIPSEVYSEGGKMEWEDFATPQGGEYVIPKTSWSSTRHTALMDLLKQSGIDTVLVCGLITSVCVQHSAFGIFEAGYRTLLVTDACADRGKARHDAALALYGDYMYELLTTEDLCTPANPFYLQPAQPVWLRADSRTTTTSNIQYPIFYKVENNQTSEDGSIDKRMNASARTSSTSSLSTLSYSPMTSPTAGPSDPPPGDAPEPIRV